VYNELYTAWQFELENSELGSLPPDFYAHATDYIRKIREEKRMLDKKTMKTNLLENELKRVKCMLHELVWMRYKKIVALIPERQRIPSKSLTVEEASLFATFSTFAESYQKFAEKLLLGKALNQVSKVGEKKVHKRIALRFIKTIPAIIGVDMKTYGPFMAEDVASVPAENAKILVKQGLAKVVEVS